MPLSKRSTAFNGIWDTSQLPRKTLIPSLTLAFEVFKPCSAINRYALSNDRSVLSRSRVFIAVDINYTPGLARSILARPLFSV